MFSKQLLIVFSISFIALIHTNSWEDANIPSRFLNALNRQNMIAGLENLEPWLDKKNLTLTVCGEVLANGSSGARGLADYIGFEQNRYNQGFTNISQFPVSHDQDKTEYLHFEITMRSSMGFQDNRTIKLKAVDKSGTFQFADWLIQEIEISGSCLDSKNIDRSLIIDEWVPKLERVNKTAIYFMNEVIRKVPFEDQHFFHEDSIIFHKWYSSFSIETYFEWLQKFSALFKYRAELNTFIITENIDHIVFRTSHIFENKTNNKKTEVWNFIIEATCEEVWTIRQMQFRPDYGLFNNIERDTKAWIKELHFLIQEIEIISQNRPNGNLYEIEKYGRAIRFENPELVPKHDNKTDLFVKVFEIPSSVKLEKCEKFLKDDGNYQLAAKLSAIIYCYYSYYSSGNQKLSREVKLEIFGWMDIFTIEAVIVQINIVDQINIKYLPFSEYIFTDLSNYETHVISHNDFAIKVARLLIGQSSFEYLNWKSNYETLVESIKINDFKLKICGKTHKENVAEFFKIYLERNRRTTKLSKFHIEVYTKNEATSIQFKIVCTSINSMGLFMTEIYKFYAKQIWQTYKIKSIEIEGACIYENLNIDFIPSKMSEDIDLKKEINDFVDRIEFPYIGNEDNINIHSFSENFEGYIAANPNYRAVYQLYDFLIYLQNFVDINKLRQQLNSTILKIEQNSVVVRMSMIFDNFIFHVNQSSNNEWIFLIEGSRNAEEKWEITKLVMSPRLELLAYNITQRRAATYHMLNSEQENTDILRIVQFMPRNSSHPKIDIENCETIIYNNTYHQYQMFFERFMEFLKLSDPMTALFKWNKPPAFNLVESFKFEIKYELTISGVRKAFVVNHFAEYNFKHGYYHDTKLELTCPIDAARYYTYSIFSSLPHQN